MEELLNKINKIKALVHIRKIQLHQIQMSLAQTRQKKIALVAEMRKKQIVYLEGVEQLNSVRSSNLRDNLKTLEEAVDYSKFLWFSCFKSVQEAESLEKKQLQQTVEAEIGLKAIEQIQSNYQATVDNQLQKIEQKQLDEFAIRSHRKFHK